MCLRNNHIIKIILLLVLSTTFTFCQTPQKAETVSVNGKNMYYEVYGEGPPLIFLHGYSLSSKHWKPYVADFQKDYKVYLIDLTGHGKSDAFKEDLSFRSVAEDLNSLLMHLRLQKIQAIGFSFGGDVLFQLALISPDLITSMITIGAVGTWIVDDFPEHKNAFTFENRANFPWLKDNHNDDEKIKVLMEQFQNYTVKLSDQDLQNIKPEVLIILGDDDEGMDFHEVARVKKNLPKSDLWVLPNVAHSAHEGETKPEFITVSKAFLSKNN